jgi:junctophilin
MMHTRYAGTYQGQWLRGVRHGYGIRQSVSYEVALRYPTHSAMTAISIPVPGSTPAEKEDDVLLRERDFRIEESRGGFVLRARTYPVDQDAATGKHRMILDKHGRPSLRKTIVKV